MNLRMMNQEDIVYNVYRMDLRELLGRNVDVVTERGLKTRIRDRVLEEAIRL